MKLIKTISILTVPIVLSGCEEAQKSMLVLNENKQATVISNSGYHTVTVSGTYTIQTADPQGHYFLVDAPCGRLSFSYPSSNVLRYENGHALSSNTAECGLHSQAADQEWHLVLKSVTGFTARPPNDWPY
ncbi:hypothetical protein [Pseudomonas frederiksbergensis]|uniref:hypothetical protein n=1 Tax=Pseudomonas frederiksbergensis TaxID=104087 RepID=UPI00101AD4BC|nr:hypothetical protein [Pseudomonas frederiksbergensis]